MNLSELENSIGAKFPKKWHEIYDTGAMEWLEVGSEVFRANRDKYLNDPRAFLILGGCDCEPLMFEEIPERIKWVGELVSWRIEYDGAVLRKGLTLIPFAMRANGDLFCFVYEGSLTDEPKIILYCHDCFEDEYLMWANLDELLYECMLEACDPDFGVDISNESWQAHLNYLTEQQRKRLVGRSGEELYGEYLALPEITENIWEKREDRIF